MLILLPPSEGKAETGAGPALDLDGLGLAELNGARTEVLAALEGLCAGPAETAMDILGLTANQAGAVQRNRALRTAPALRAADLYTGVLYERLDLPGLLSGPAAGRTAESVLILSGLWGAVGVGDALPPYRLSMGVKLPPLGGLAAFWRRHLAEPLAKRADGQLTVDCRSAAYAAAFRPEGEAAAVRVVRETRSGGAVRRSVVSHMAKATRGAIARTLLEQGAEPETPDELAAALNDLGHRAETDPPKRAGAPATVTVVED
ncbi:peroxide stress protein YaaA [Nocardiopsis coralliicola]